MQTLDTARGNFTPRAETFGPYTVEVFVSPHSAVTMSRGDHRWQEPRMSFRISRGLRHIASGELNATSMGTVSGVQATCRQILEAVVGDEDIFSGAQTRPNDAAAVHGEAVDSSSDPTDSPAADQVIRLDETEPDRHGYIRDTDVWPIYAETSGQFGDAARGLAFDTRYRRKLDDGTWVVVTLGFYVEDLQGLNLDDHVPDYGLVCQIEYMHCTDADSPGDTEIRCDYRNINIDAPYGHTLAFYERKCLEAAKRDHRDDSMHDAVLDILGV